MVASQTANSREELSVEPELRELPNAQSDVIQLRTKLRSSTSLRIDVLAAISAALRNHHMTLSDDLLKGLTLALDSEISDTRLHVIL